MGSNDYTGEDDNKNEVVQIQVHPDRVGADPTEGWRRGARGTLRKSCDTCTSSKTKCCGSIPCDRCKKRNIKCMFSKRRRCGPKARLEDDKRARTGPSDDSDNSTEKMASHEHSSPLLTPLRSASLHPSLPGVPLTLPEPLKGLEAGGGGVTFTAPLTTDGLSGLVELIAPSLSDGGGSGSSGGSCAESAYPRMTAAHTAPSYAQQEPPGLPMNIAGNNSANVGGAVSFLSDPGPAPHQHGSGLPVIATPPAEPPPGAPGAPPSSSILPSSVSSAREVLARQASIRSARRLTPSLSAPAPGLEACHPPRGMPARSSSSGTTHLRGTGEGCFEGPASKVGFFPGASVAEPSAGGIRRWVREGGLVPVAGGDQQAPSAPALPPLPRRGALPMELEARPKAHLKTFMRTAGSVLLLAGTEALRDAAVEDGSEEEMPQARSPTAAAAAASTAAGGGGGETGRFDPMAMDATEGESDKTGGATGGGSGLGKHDPTAPGTAGGGPGEQGASGAGGKKDVVDVFANACRAEAWAAIAMGALFGEAAKEEGELYASRAVAALSGCLDAPLPEVASAMILLTLFWMHSMDTRKVGRYFGFAQQVGLELGPLMPEGLRHTIAFVSVLVIMTLNLHKRPSIALNVRDHTVWGVTLQSRPGLDPFVAALGAATVASSKMLHDEADKSTGAVGVDGIMGSNLRAPVPPAQELTDILAAAVETLSSAAVQEGDQNPDHMLTILHGLKGYTHVARDETEEAEASAKLTLAIIDRQPAVLHLPLTFTLAEASRRLLQQPRIGRPARRLGPSADALRAARSNLAFARPAVSTAKEAGGGGGGAGKGKMGGWCTFGDTIMAAFVKGGGGGGGDISAEINNLGERSRPTPGRAGSMSPPPKRSGPTLSRAGLASHRWAPSTNSESNSTSNDGSNGGTRRSRSDGEGASTLRRWHVPTPVAAASGPTPRSALTNATNAEAPSDWVDRVRKMPIAAARTPSPNIVQRLGAVPDPRTDERRSLSALALLGPGTMPTGTPNQAARYVSEPDGLTLLSGVAAPYMPARQSYEDRDREPVRRGGVGSVRFERPPGSGGGVGGGERDADDLPPPANPTMSTGVSFDPNREDPSFPFHSLA